MNCLPFRKSSVTKITRTGGSLWCLRIDRVKHSSVIRKVIKQIKWKGVAFTNTLCAKSNMSISAFIDLNLEKVDAAEMN